MSQAFFQISPAALRRVRLREELPTDHPEVLDQIRGLMDTLPDPAVLGAEEQVGSMTVAHPIRNRLDAYPTSLAGAADTAGTSQILHAGTTGMITATATTSNPATGSATVGRARNLRTLPPVEAAYAAGRISTAHVGFIAEATGRITRSQRSKRWSSRWLKPPNPTRSTGSCKS